MAVAVDAVVASGASTGVSSYSWSHTCGASATLLTVTENNGDGAGGVSASGITYNGTALTVTAAHIIGGTFFESSIWGLISPPTGAAHTVAVTLPSSRGFIASGSISFTGTDTTTPFYTAGVGTFQNAAAATDAVTATGASAGDMYLATTHTHCTTSFASNSPSTNEWQTLLIGSTTSASADVQAGTAGAFSWTELSNEKTAVAIGIKQASGGGTTYNLSVSDSGSAADSLSNTLTAVNALTEAGTAAMTAAGALTANNALSESGTAADTVSGGLALAGSVSETGSATDTVTGTPAYSNAVSESGSAADSVSNALTAANAVAEAGTAADSLSTVLTAVNSVSEAGSAADTVSPGNIYAQNVSESGSAADSLANQLTAVGAVSEAGSATDAVDPSGSTFGVFLTEALNAADGISATGGSGGVSTVVASSGANLPGYVPDSPYTRDELQQLGKGLGPHKRSGQIFGEPDPLSPTMTSRADAVAQRGPTAIARHISAAAPALTTDDEDDEVLAPLIIASLFQDGPNIQRMLLDKALRIRIR